MRTPKINVRTPKLVFLRAKEHKRGLLRRLGCASVAVSAVRRVEGGREYFTSSSPDLRRPSEKLNTILKELEINPVYTFENLGSEDIKKEILNKTKGLSGIYMIVNKITKDYYIGSASNNRLYARFCNHVIYFRGAQ